MRKTYQNEEIDTNGPTVPEAVSVALSHARQGDTVLLSPACASFGMFQNFVDRAGAFRRAAEALQTVTRQAG